MQEEDPKAAKKAAKIRAKLLKKAGPSNSDAAERSAKAAEKRVIISFLMLIVAALTLYFTIL